MPRGSLRCGIVEHSRKVSFGVPDAFPGDLHAKFLQAIQESS